ncbi:hypothetical protein M404DRAFT_292845 [Pisolithus tinctorius Marx 270]|uniref:Uncharacterized protein n=1 Tax=Pisolithus tinctorius Marx 270 TaxID=870435 RepID=A0A0C3NL42_PISTI|nr:hypothetical protein M404DRAFT_292845 [Pisolithus tinctorius Marx 270]
MGENVRVPFSKEHDAYLVKYLARYCPTKQNRAGNKVYKDLVENRGRLTGVGRGQDIIPGSHGENDTRSMLSILMQRYQGTRRHMRSVPAIRTMNVQERGE